MKNDSWTLWMLLKSSQRMTPLSKCGSVDDGIVATLNITRLKVIYYKTKMFNIFSRSRWHTEMLNMEQTCVFCKGSILPQHKLLIGSERIPQNSKEVLSRQWLNRDHYNNLGIASNSELLTHCVQRAMRRNVRCVYFILPFKKRLRQECK